MHGSRRLVSILSIVGPLLGVACAGPETQRAMVSLTKQLEREFGQTPYLRLRNARVLAIIYGNAPFAGLPEEPRRELAYAIAHVARRRYAGEPPLDSVGVIFVADRVANPAFVAREGAYWWRATELVAPPAVTVERDAGRAAR